VPLVVCFISLFKIYIEYAASYSLVVKEMHLEKSSKKKRGLLTAFGKGELGSARLGPWKNCASERTLGRDGKKVCVTYVKRRDDSASRFVCVNARSSSFFLPPHPPFLKGGGLAS
jgi:hypothetical protein